MSWRVLTFLLMIWMIGQFTCLIFEGTYIGTGEVNVMNPMVVYRNPQQMDLFGTVTNSLNATATAIPTILMWDYSWFQGNYELVRWILLFPLSAGVVLGLVQIFIVGIQRLFTR